jgi:hypothetical protein
MLDGRNVQRLAVVIKADAIITDPKSKLRRIDILESFYVAFSGSSQIGEGVKNS